ncbi:alpha-ketoglutarate dependent dioxygenase [Corynespora cassiicola Philippines]|uniref:Alpha-ketoglutarate dependent dioxygenase n=1 Tax=Corynespora cassiicola Philippines TaxID=1448308 RepID=A0A2T2N186_CORCC|nr:alpha-ketoglutarate dependent dioxygenase [Corynespora cassiicola Philippines]
MAFTSSNSTDGHLKIRPMVHGSDKKLNFGAYIIGLDLNNASDAEVDQLREAILRHKIVVVKGQQTETPDKNWEVIKKLDPMHHMISQEEFGQLFHPTGEGLIAMLKLATVPTAEHGHIHLMGKGYQGDDHYGLKKLNLGEAFAGNYYSKPLAEEDFRAGVTRFQSWHMDGPLYKVHPPYISSLRFIQLPDGDQTIEWADGSGLSLKTKPGRTAFFSTSQLYDMLTDEERTMVDNSAVEYMHYPYEWIRGCRGNPNGLNVADEGREKPLEAMEEIARDEQWTKTYPMVWFNELTKERSLQVQPNCVRRLLIRRSADQKEPEIIEGSERVREFMNKLQQRIVRPEYIYVGPEEEGDHVFWYNWGTMHSKIDYPIAYGPRVVHQGWIPSHRVPRGPTAVAH